MISTQRQTASVQSKEKHSRLKQEQSSHSLFLLFVIIPKIAAAFL